MRDYFLASTGVYSTKLTVVDSPPAVVALSQNQPNPFSNSTEIAFALPKSSVVRLQVFDLQGRCVATLAQGAYPAGRHVMHWNGLDGAKGRVRPGVYTYRLYAAGTSHSEKDDRAAVTLTTSEDPARPSSDGRAGLSRP